ncbi:MAG: glycosyltransferase [Nitrososphaerales archaeon]
MSNRIKISATILTRNSERRLRECIESLIEIVDEIIVIDGYSTDKTVSICNDYPKIRVFQKSFEGFAKERIYALGKVKGDWVIQIDSDEVTEEKCASELRRMILSDRYDAIKVWNKAFSLASSCEVLVRHQLSKLLG